MFINILLPANIFEEKVFTIKGFALKKKGEGDDNLYKNNLENRIAT